MRPYLSGRRLMTVLTVLVVTRVALTAVNLVGWLVIAGGTTDVELLMTSARAAGVAEIIGLPVYLAAVVLFLIWVYRATNNLTALGSQSLRFNASSAVWGFFIPFLNLVQGHQVMAMLWTESQPVPLDEHSPRRKTTLVNWWWGIYLFTSVTGFFYPTTIEPGELRSAAIRVCVIDLTRIIAGALFLWVVRATQRRQEEQWRDLELRASVPSPTADGLR